MRALPIPLGVLLVAAGGAAFASRAGAKTVLKHVFSPGQLRSYSVTADLRYTAAQPGGPGSVATRIDGTLTRRVVSVDANGSAVVETTLAMTDRGAGDGATELPGYRATFTVSPDGTTRPIELPSERVLVPGLRTSALVARDLFAGLPATEVGSSADWTNARIVPMSIGRILGQRTEAHISGRDDTRFGDAVVISQQGSRPVELTMPLRDFAAFSGLSLPASASGQAAWKGSIAESGTGSVLASDGQILRWRSRLAMHASIFLHGLSGNDAKLMPSSVGYDAQLDYTITRTA